MLIGSHLVRAVLVVVLIAVLSPPRWRCCSGCCSSSSSSADPPSRPTRCCSRTSSPTGGSTRAFGLNTLAEQVNQAIGLAVGGIVVTTASATQGLVFDLATFLVAAAVLAGPSLDATWAPAEGLTGFIRDAIEGGRHLFTNRVLTYLLLLSVTSTLAMAAEAVAIPKQHPHSPAWAACSWLRRSWGQSPGLLVVSRLGAVKQNRSVLWMSRPCRCPLLITVVEPPLRSSGWRGSPAARCRPSCCPSSRPSPCSCPPP